MVCNLIIDGNYILSKLVFTLHKNNLLFGALHSSLETSIMGYKTLYPFSEVYLVSDSKEKSWRKKITGQYKTNRKKDSDIDWNFAYTSYAEVKEKLTGIKILEAPHIERDDWISFLVEKSNQEGKSTIIISNDYDIKQLIKFNLDPLYINIMTNEMFNKEKLFMPKNYQIFIDGVSKLPSGDIFDLNDNNEFLSLLKNLIKKYEVSEVDCVESLLVKLISGDRSDNIESVWSQEKNGKKRGIGETGAKNIYDDYLTEFGDVDMDDPDLYENIADLICEKKKISKINITDIVDNISENSKLINLKVDNLPKEIVNTMETLYQDQLN
jgi:5'-3' exonuclease